MTPDEARERALDLFGIPAEIRPALRALNDQREAWIRDNPGVDPAAATFSGRHPALASIHQQMGRLIVEAIGW